MALSICRLDAAAGEIQPGLPGRASNDRTIDPDSIDSLCRGVSRRMLLNRHFWLTHAWGPAVLFGLLAAATAFTGVDEALARAWAFDAASGHFIGVGAGRWWAKDLLHADGGLLIRVLDSALVLSFGLSFFFASLRSWRRPLGFLVLSIALGAGAVGLLKESTNVDCPWSLTEFGGTMPYVHLFADRPDSLPPARCFPGGHSSSGFALLALYFPLLGRRRRTARAVLATALLVGGAFALGQEARGAHFFSHDLWSAAIVWFASLWVYAVVYRGDVRGRIVLKPAQLAIHSYPVPASAARTAPMVVTMSSSG